MGAQQEVDGVAVLVDGPVEIFPVALDADVCLIHSPALSNWQLASAKRFLQYRQQLERPAMDGRMIDRRPTFGHHFFKMTQTQRIGDIPAHARQNHLQRIVQAFTLASAGFSVFIDSLISDFVSPEFYRPSLTATQPLLPERR